MLALGFEQKILNIDKVYETVNNTNVPLYRFTTPPKHLIDKSVKKMNNPPLKLAVDTSDANIKDLIRN